MARGGWVYVGGRAGNKPAAAEKVAVTLACKRFIDKVLIEAVVDTYAAHRHPKGRPGRNATRV